jgi:penicillin-binding protein 1A
MASQAPSRVKRTLITLLKMGLYVFVLGLIALVVAVSVAVSQLPSYQELIRRDDLGQMIRVRAADGSVIHSMGPSFGEWLTHDQIPAIMRNAMIAVEDRRFHSHPGVDPIGIARGIWVGFDRSDRVRGVSTISQQLARNIFLTNDRSLGRKVREGILALALERRFSKEQVLELYLNRVYFGGGAYGIDAASRRFFGHSATDLDIGQAAIIAGLVKAPSNYSPTADAEAARSRANIVLQLMVRNGTITEAQARTANPKDVEFVRTSERQNSARYFTDWVLPQLDMLIDENVQPIDVWTTLDVGLQRIAQDAINANAPGGAQGALVSLDRDGAVRALVGGRDYVESIYNRATQATRQPGSAFKLFVYLAALESGYTPTSTVVDEPLTIAGWSPRNDNGRYQGPVSLRAALALSINTVAARLAQDVGTRAVADMAQRFGITTKVGTNPSMALGTSEVRLIDLTRAYASVAQRGVAVVPYGVRRVTTADGALLYQHRTDESRVLVAPWVAAQMTDLLQAAVMTGTGRAAQLGRPTAGKTGTTSSNKDGWFVGFSSGLTTGVWFGRDDNRALPGLAGGRAPARAFHHFMSRAVANRPAENFEIEVALPDWQVEPDEESWFAEPDEYQRVDPDGYAPSQSDERPPPAPRDPGSVTTDELNQEWLDHAIGRRPAQPAPDRSRPPPDRGPPSARRQPPPGFGQDPPVMRPGEAPPPTLRPRAPGTAD